MSEDLKVILDVRITTTGVFNTFVISDEDKLRVVVTDADSGNVILVKARIIGQRDWDTIKTITGNTKEVIKVSTYDQVQLECTSYDSLSNFVEIISSSFNDAGGSTVIDAPTGGSVDNDTIVFTSSDSSVTITADPENNIIDFIATGAGSPFTKYVKSVALIDWAGPSLGDYTLSIPFSEHGVANPLVASYETNAGTFDLILVSTNVDSSHNIIITVNQTPDARFIGKIVIE